MKKTTNKKGGAGTAVAIGAGVIALAAASYYFFGPEGKKNQKKVKGWMIKMKGDIVDKLEDVKEVTEPIYHQIVDAVAAKYAKGTKKITPEDVSMYVEVLKKQWRGISQSTTGAKKTVKKAVQKSAPKKVVKK